MRAAARTAISVFIVLFLLTGVVYPLAIAAVAELAFSSAAHGSLVRDGSGQVTGSILIGQNFSSDRYFQGRVSATTDHPYNPAGSAGSNLGPANPDLAIRINTSLHALRERGIAGSIPAELVTASGSGLDPHLSIGAALVQVPAVAQARNLSAEEVRSLVLLQAIEDPVPGHPACVNVLSLNRALDMLDREGR
jgi:K+-transporting ATPase ATPase C chain